MTAQYRRSIDLNSNHNQDYYWADGSHSDDHDDPRTVYSMSTSTITSRAPSPHQASQSGPAVPPKDTPRDRAERGASPGPPDPNGHLYNSRTYSTPSVRSRTGVYNGAQNRTPTSSGQRRSIVYQTPRTSGSGAYLPSSNSSVRDFVEENDDENLDDCKSLGPSSIYYQDTITIQDKDGESIFSWDSPSEARNRPYPPPQQSQPSNSRQAAASTSWWQRPSPTCIVCNETLPYSKSTKSEPACCLSCAASLNDDPSKLQNWPAAPPVQRTIEGGSYASRTSNTPTILSAFAKAAASAAMVATGAVGALEVVRAIGGKMSGPDPDTLYDPYSPGYPAVRAGEDLQEPAFERPTGPTWHTRPRPVQTESRKEHQKRVVDATESAIQAGSYVYRSIVIPLQQSIQRCIEGTVFYNEDSEAKEWKTRWPDASLLDNLRGAEYRDPASLSVLKTTPLDAARLLQNSYKFRPPRGSTVSTATPKTGVLNCSSPYEFEKTLKEDGSITRVSTLHASLSSTPGQQFYALHSAKDSKGKRSELYTSSMVYSPGVVVFQNDQGDPVDPYSIDVVSCAAVNTGEVLSGKTKAEIPALETEIEGLMYDRMGRILYLFEKMGVRNIVLHAFGAGEFKNRMPLIVRFWASLLIGQESRFAFSFDRVIFAIPGDEMYANFDGMFVPWIRHMGGSSPFPDKTVCVVCKVYSTSGAEYVTCSLECTERLFKYGGNREMCEYCHRNSRLEGDRHCGPDCSKKAKIACLLCRCRPRNGRYHLCGQICKRISLKSTPLLLEAHEGHYTFTKVKEHFVGAWKAKSTPAPVIKRIYKIFEDDEFRTPYDKYLVSISDPKGAFGAGIYTSSASNKAYGYGFDRNGTHGALIVTKVVLGKVRTVEAFAEVSSLPEGFDSVVFDRYNGTLNETIVYSDDAIRPVFLIMF